MLPCLKKKKEKKKKEWGDQDDSVSKYACHTNLATQVQTLKFMQQDKKPTPTLCHMTYTHTHTPRINLKKTHHLINHLRDRGRKIMKVEVSRLYNTT